MYRVQHYAGEYNQSTPMRIMDFVLLAFVAVALSIVLSGDMVLR